MLVWLGTPPLPLRFAGWLWLMGCGVQHIQPKPVSFQMLGLLLLLLKGDLLCGC
jgi:hypothetical protein